MGSVSIGQPEEMLLVSRLSHAIYRSKADQCRHQNLCHTGEGRCPSQKWVPAFAGKAQEGDAALNHLNASGR
jgi:hypothetical protein